MKRFSQQMGVINMKNIKLKIMSVVLAVAMFGSMGAFPAAAVGEDEVTDNSSVVTEDPVVDTPVIEDPGYVEDSDYVDPGYSEPSYDEPNYNEPSYDDANSNTSDTSGDYSDDYTDDTSDDYSDDYSDNTTTDNTYTDDSSSQTNYDADYYNNYYDSSYSSDFESQEIYDENGYSYDDFERATDYDSASVSTENTVDMYNSNGSDDNTLTSDDWDEIKLNLGTTSANGTGDFSFIKDNTSNEDSNLSILLLIFGIVFVVASIIMLIYVFVSNKKYKKLAKAQHTNGQNNIRSLRENVRNFYEEETFDINKYLDDNSLFDTDYNDDF